ncbi:hypothetical protein GO988_01390 [Hymenobacter sp. HMF4947]|uniref:Outer membrane protein beta-barrel domain-containing protein n=1 Tax=Hymenobacter ginkgonis TaxID=2682976 RepID=A0A7K1T9K1_9BACT|nr:hypothetical protein [Hymenobacter ginkgonis]MVN74972.1 hypothetical protein [Hymenobacter ginkgonis]
MPTPTMSDEELDSLFRRGAESYPTGPVPPADWDRMAAKLDAATTTQQLRRKVVRGLAIEAVAVLLLLWQGYRLAPLATTASHRALPERSAGRPALAGHAQQTAPAGQAALAGTTWAAHRPILLHAAEASNRRVVGSVPAATAVPQAATAASSAPAPRAALGHVPLALAGVINSQQSLLDKRNKKLLANRTYAIGSQPRHVLLKARDSATGAFAALPAAGTHTAAAEITADYAEVNPPKTELEQPVTSAAAAQPDSVAQLAVRRLLAMALVPLPDTLAHLARPAADSAHPEQRPLAPMAYRLLVGVVGAPSVSAVRTAQTARLGGDFGLTVEYRLTPRLRVRTGLISSQKRYSAASSDYQAPASWQWFAADYQVDANCRITEIPLDLRVDVLRRHSYTVFASLGATSLLMRDERYSYDWMMNGQTFTKEAHVVKGSNSFLSVLSFSAGIERPLGARWALQAEPFWQVPLGGVGAGQVRLSSAGLSFSLKYSLFR